MFGLELFVRVQVTPKTIWVIAMTLGYLSDLEDLILKVSTSHTADI